MRYVFAFFLPPLSIAMCGRRWGHFTFNLIFWLVSLPLITFVGVGLLGRLFCTIHAVIVCRISSVDKRMDRLVNAIQHSQPPAAVAMLPNGNRVMNYSFTQTNGHATAQSFIPGVDLLSAGTEGEITTRTLQVNLDANNVVEDYEYNDSTNNMQSTSGYLGTSSTMTPASNTGPGH